MAKEWLFGKTLDGLQAVAAECGMPRYAAAQIAAWLYKKGATQIAQMTDISLANRTRLEERYEVGLTPPAGYEESTDGTKKYLFPTLGGHYIESAYIPDGERATLCVSSQAGCRMGCEFCMTAKQGFQQNLSSGEILNQVRSIAESAQLTNIVYMGMGEPLDNLAEVIASLEVLTSPWGYGWSPTRITVSTIGVLSALAGFLDRTRVHLAVSLHNPFHDGREELMPAEKAFPIADVVALLKRYDFTHQRRVSFEYIVFRGLNDTPAHVKELARLLDGLKCRINLIRFHAIPGSPFESPSESEMVRLRDALTRKGIITTIRASRGEDIKAACGLLSTKHK
ncbi:23S rRNA (adenine(2503)-C(2))-methyltransferase RlmN [Alistipes sp. OttesenSCG-928-B03]|nr:23S rRNA (adenine(2503)-C(2))-methyltransferase RlmN [Alistipes sp. OttesenSCG-928-B03]